MRHRSRLHGCHPCDPGCCKRSRSMSMERSRHRCHHRRSAVGQEHVVPSFTLCPYSPLCMKPSSCICPSAVHRSDQATSFRMSISTVRAAPASPFVSSRLAGLVMFIAGEDLCMPVPNLSCLVRTTCFQELHVPYLVQASGAKHACLCAWTQERLIVSVYATCSYRSHAITMSNFALAK
jgi:hypothetical protein